MSRPKLENLLEQVRQHVDDDAYDLSEHAKSRMAQRDVDLPEVVYALRHGWHERRKDKYDEAYQAWNYAIRGKTVDERKLRVVVTFEENMLLVTVIDLDQE
jgi:hypothetical protein